jgi:F-type H+-transporting ATPase subunit b
MLEAENWVAVAFLCFLGLLAYLGAHRKMIDAIDHRQARIKSELEQARRLREEAQALLGEFERKARDADAAVAAAEKIIATTAKGKVAEDLLARGIEDVKQKFN